MDTGKPAVQYNYSGKEREDEAQEAHEEMGQQGLRRQSVNRLIWLDEEILTSNKPRSTSIRLIGVFDVETRHAMIHLVVEHNYTEYRVTRWDKKIPPVLRADVDDLKYAHRNMVEHFLKTYSNCDFQKILRQWLTWNKNPAYHAALSPLLK